MGTTAHPQIKCCVKLASSIKKCSPKKQKLKRPFGHVNGLG
jgi:hypothetical protein